MAGQKLRAIMIVEIAGRPPEHVKETLKLHVGQFKNLKDVEVINETISEPKRLEIEQEMYTCFAEIEIKTINLARLIELIFDFMPSSVEILEPAELKLDLQESISFLNNLTGRLHRYDEIAKMAQIQKQQLEGKLQELMEKEKNGQTQIVTCQKDEKKPAKRKKAGKTKKRKSK